MAVRRASAPVADAAMQGNREAVRRCCKQAADVNAAQGDGMTALHWAAMKDDADLVQTLLYAGANVSATTRIGAYTPLLLAAKNGSASVIAPLLKAGADANGATANGTTPLMFAAASGNIDAVAALVEAGANVNAKEPVRGLTPAMFAAASNRAAVLALLAEERRRPEGHVEGHRPGGVEQRPRGAARVHDRQSAARAEPPAGGRNGGLRAAAGRGAARWSGPGQRRRGASRRGRGPQTAGVDRNYQLNELVAAQGGLTPLLLATREGHAASVNALLDAGRRRQPAERRRSRPARC